MILGVILTSPQSGVFVFFWSLNQKVAHGGLKDSFLHPRTSKLSFPGTLHSHFLQKYNQKVSQIVRSALLVCSFVRSFVWLFDCLLACLFVWCNVVSYTGCYPKVYSCNVSYKITSRISPGLGGKTSGGCLPDASQFPPLL